MAFYQNPERAEELTIESEVQWTALFDPVALDVYLMLEGIGPCSTVELSERLEYPTREIYPPLRLLLNAMLVRQVGFDDDRESSVSIVDVRAESLRFPPTATTRTQIVRLTHLCRLYSERKARIHALAIERGWLTDFAIDPGSSMEAKLGFLHHEDVEAISEHMKQIRRIFRDARKPKRHDESPVALVSAAWSISPIVPVGPGQSANSPESVAAL